MYCTIGLKVSSLIERHPAFICHYHNANEYNIHVYYDIIYVNRPRRTDHVNTRIEIHFIDRYYMYSDTHDFLLHKDKPCRYRWPGLLSRQLIPGPVKLIPANAGAV